MSKKVPFLRGFFLVGNLRRGFFDYTSGIYGGSIYFKNNLSNKK
ncbi:hypothetical protein SAMN02799633_00115 [Bacillus sp. UNCCL81]|nr:hypothetical protein SAMN02799633_00115 [Bacillus sp. UNCCL81]